MSSTPTHSSIYPHSHTHLPSLTHTGPDATFRDLLLAIRKDEATHREVNHTFANMNESDDNPFLAEEQYHAQVETMPDATSTTAEKKRA